MIEPTPTAPTGQIYVVRASDHFGNQGYLHLGGSLVTAANAWALPRDLAVEEAQRLMRSSNIDRSTVELVEILDGQPDLATAVKVTVAAVHDYIGELAVALRALPVRDLQSVLAVLDKSAVEALRKEADRVKLSWMDPPRHETGRLS